MLFFFLNFNSENSIFKFAIFLEEKDVILSKRQESFKSLGKSFKFYTKIQKFMFPITKTINCSFWIQMRISSISQIELIKKLNIFHNSLFIFVSLIQKFLIRTNKMLQIYSYYSLKQYKYHIFVD